MPNMKAIITGHKKLLEKKSSQQHGNATESYIGCSDTEFKSLYYNLYNHLKI